MKRHDPHVGDFLLQVGNRGHILFVACDRCQRAFTVRTYSLGQTRAAAQSIHICEACITPYEENYIITHYLAPAVLARTQCMCCS